jgi:hypothetical protein
MIINKKEELFEILRDCVKNIENEYKNIQKEDFLILNNWIIGDILINLNSNEIKIDLNKLLYFIQEIISNKKFTNKIKSNLILVLGNLPYLKIGKICLFDVDIAKTTIPFFITEVVNSNILSIRNNIFVVLCDLCVKYTSVVDNYVIRMSECLLDSSTLIKKNSCYLFTQLLSEGEI